MKIVKKSLLSVTALLLCACIMCCTVAAARENKSYVVESNIVYIQFPDSFKLTDAVGNYLLFTDEEYNSLLFDVRDNTFIPDGVKSFSPEQIKALFLDAYLSGSETGVELGDVTAEVVDVNGVAAYKLTGVYIQTYDGVPENYTFCAYITAVEENAYYLIYEDIDGENFSTEFIDETADTMVVNGTYFDGDKPTVTYDFANAESYAEIIDDANEYLDYGSLYEDEIEEEHKRKEAMASIKTVFFIICILPFIVCSAVTLVLAVILAKKKKQLHEFERNCDNIYTDVR